MGAKEKLFYAVRDYRETMKAIYARHDQSMEIINRYKDSDRYEEDKQKAEERLAIARKACKDEHGPNLLAAAEEFEKLVAGVGAIAPTTDQLNMLTALKLNEKLHKDTVIMVGRTLADSPLAIDTLRNIAQEKGVQWPAELVREVFTLSEAQKVCSNIRSRVTSLWTYMERPGDLQRYVNYPNSVGVRSLIGYDRDYDNADQCFQAFAIVDEATSKRFFDFVTPKGSN